MTDISTDFTATGTSEALLLEPFLDAPQSASCSVAGTFVATLVLQRTVNGGQTWDTVLTATDVTGTQVLRDPGTYRWSCTAYTSGTATVTLADLVDPVVIPIIRNAHGDTVFAATDAGVQAETVRLGNDVWHITGSGAPTDGVTGAGFAGPASMYFDIDGAAAYLNSGTIDDPEWAAFDISSGSVLSVTANGGLSSSGGSSPNITVSDTNLIELRDTGDISGNSATTTLATSATTATYATTAGTAAPTAHASTHVTGGSDIIANVVAAGNSGLMSGADKTKLDAATASSTVSTIVLRDAAGRTQFVDPSAAQDAATKSYVDSVAVGLTVHTPAAVATTANITLSGEQTIDGVLTSATRILVKDQSTGAQNGLYVTAAGAWTRATDMDVWSEVPGSFVFVQGGTTQTASGWANTSTLSGTIGVTVMTWAQFSQAGTYLAGTGLTLIGSTFSANYGTSSGTAAQGNDSRITGALQSASNLSDVANAATSVNNLGGASSTGTGGLARASSPIFTTPNIGTATGSVSGNAGTATVLQTARNINGVSFNGSANITVPAAGSTLTDAVPLTGLATQTAHTFVANATGSTAAPTAISVTTAASELADWKANTFSNFLAVVNADTGTSLTLSATQRGTILTMSNASAITLTLHATADIGYSVTVYQKGAGQITFAAGSGATLHNRQTLTKSAGQYSVCTLFVEANSGGSAAVWVLAGDTGA